MANHIYTIEIGDARTHYLWRSGYLESVGGIRVENEPIYLGETPEIIIPAGDTIAIYEYRSMVSFTNEELGAVPTIASITKAYSIMLNRAVDSNGLQNYTLPSYTNLQSVIVSIGYSDEYRLGTLRGYGYPMQLNNLDGTIVARMDDYENYINSQPNLLDYYNNPANNWGYVWGAAVEPVQSRSKAAFGESHFAVAGSMYGNTLLSHTFNEAKSVSYQPSDGLFLQGTNIISIVDSASNTLSSRQTSIEQIRSKMNEVINQGNQSVSIGTEPTDPKSGDTWFDGNSLKIYIGLELSTEDGNSTISTEDGVQDLDLELASPWLELGGVSSSISSSSIAPAGSQGDLWYDSANLALNVFNGSTWEAVAAGDKWSSGWVSEGVSNGASLTFDHNLGSEDYISQIYMAKDAFGTDAVSVSNVIHRVEAPNDHQFGAQIYNATSTSLKVALAQEGWVGSRDPVGTQPSITGNWGTTYTHIKVVVRS